MIRFCRKYTFQMNQQNPGQMSRVFLCDVQLKVQGQVDPLTGFAANLPDMDEWANQVGVVLQAKEFPDLKTFACYLRENYLQYSKSNSSLDSNLNSGESQSLDPYGTQSLAHSRNENESCGDSFAEMIATMSDQAVVLNAKAESYELRFKASVAEANKILDAKLRLRANLDFKQLQSLKSEIQAHLDWSEGEILEFLKNKVGILEVEIQVLDRNSSLRRFHFV